MFFMIFQVHLNILQKHTKIQIDLKKSQIIVNIQVGLKKSHD